MAKVADAIHKPESTVLKSKTEFNVNAVTDNAQLAILAAVNSLTSEIAALGAQRESRRDLNYRPRYRSDSRYRSSSPTPTNICKFEQYWYHYKFGKKARCCNKVQIFRYI